MTDFLLDLSRSPCLEILRMGETVLDREIGSISEYIFLKGSQEPADLAMVFGTRLREPISRIWELYRNGIVPKILVSGGENRVTGIIEADVMASELVSLGVKSSHVLVENQSRNTLENVLFSRQVILERLGVQSFKRIIAVVKNYHSRRVLMTLKKHFPSSIKFLPVTYETDGFNENNWFETAVGREKVLSEFQKISLYLEKGDIEEISQEAEFEAAA